MIESKRRSMVRFLFISLSPLFILAACEERSAAGGRGGASREKKEGVFESSPPDPERVVTIDLRNPADFSGISGVTWFPMGDNEFCAIQSAKEVTLILPSGRMIREGFSMVYVDRDSEGIYQVKADSNRRLLPDVAEKLLDREISLMVADGADAADLRRQRRMMVDWWTNFTPGSSMNSGVGTRDDCFSLFFSLRVADKPVNGYRYRYRAELPRTKERIARESEVMEKKAEAERAMKRKMSR